MSNKELVQKFYDDIFINGDLSNLNNVMKENYIQHNPDCEDGRIGFEKFIKHFLSLKPKFEIINISADGNMVYVFFKCIVNDKHINKVCDIYRIEDDMIAEHWDIIEHNVENKKSNNSNGLF
ncbi:nuclear transport factor 2 family protein [Apilactobacillus xinyiensis]|uniref:Nuclear transport factor 2 family protein n=1 Tax=Apilactobacillus xinyiensis TaxID=2841032 RepID=A0ABT0I1F6_9LACO|nr:nuclear transport factor 2 family protein [Apilactobacillus xinyiensis]MCK8624556.1 nuclear transport factor 2 family protein [Apilactobacillus xinyiensis]